MSKPNKHYLIYNLGQQKFLQVTEKAYDDIQDFRLVDDAEEATIFHWGGQTFDAFREDSFVFHTILLLKQYSNIEDYLFCECDVEWGEAGVRVVNTDYTYPILICSAL